MNAMNCTQCGCTLTETTRRMVADWAFCPDCFDALLAREETPLEAEPAEPEPVKPEVACAVCGIGVTEEDARKMLGRHFCASCHERLVARPQTPVARKPEIPEPVRVEQVAIDTAAEVACHACGRMIPALGRKDVDGKPHCPECFYGR